MCGCTGTHALLCSNCAAKASYTKFSAAVCIRLADLLAIVIHDSIANIFVYMHCCDMHCADMVSKCRLAVATVGIAITVANKACCILPKSKTISEKL